MSKMDSMRESTNPDSMQLPHARENTHPPQATGVQGAGRRIGDLTALLARHKLLPQSSQSSPALTTRAVSFGLVGAFVAAVGFVVLYGLVQVAGLNKNLAYLIQAVVSIELNFVLNRSVTWRDRRGAGFASFAAMWARFHLTRVFTVMFNQALFGVLVFVGINYLIASGLCIIIVMMVNFFVGDRFIFRSRPVAASQVEVLTADLVNPEIATEPPLASRLIPRALPATGWPTVSVVVPVGYTTYGVEPTVTSLFQQDYPGEIELILVGEKDDPVWDEIRWYIDDQLVTIVEAEPTDSPVPLGMQRLAGVERAQGQILASVDSGMVVPSSWVSAGVECIRSGWPCAVGPTSVFSGAGVQAADARVGETKGRVLDPERFVEPDYVPPIAANMFLAGDVLSVIASARTRTGENGEDFLEWLWNLAQADVAVIETPAIHATLAHALGVRQILAQHIGAGAALARFSRAALNTAALPHQRTRLAGAFLSLAGPLALVLAGIIAPNWPQALILPQAGGLAGAAASPRSMPLGMVVGLVAVACALAFVVGEGIAAVIRTGQRGAMVAPLYRFAYAWSMITTGLRQTLGLPNHRSGTNMQVPRFSVVAAPDQAFTRPMPSMAPGPMRRRSMASGKGPYLTPYAPAIKWPNVSVVIPVKRNQATIGATVNSLLHQDYPGSVEILLVGDVNDSTWEPIRPFIDAGMVRIMEVTIQSSNRDANAKRTIGLQHAQGEILALTDSDMVLPAHWIFTGVQYILRGWPCVGGPMRGATGSFWDAYADLVNLGSKTPRFVVNRVVDDKRFGLPGHKPPITANVFMTRATLKNAGGFDPTFIHSYEDYSWFWTACKAGIPILCTPELQADHYHRQGWKRLLRQYTRAGRGCADFVMHFPKSPFAKLRLAQWLRVAAVLFGTLGVIVAGIVATADPGSFGIPASVAHASILSLPLGAFDPLMVIVIASLGLLGLGIVNALTVHQARAVVFPFLTLIFGLAFSYGMTVEFLAMLSSTVSQSAVRSRMRGRSMIQEFLATFPGNVTQAAIRSRTRIVTTAMYASVLFMGAGLRLWSISTRPGYEWDEPVYTSVAAHFARFGIVEYKAPIGRTALYLSHPPFYFITLGEWFRIVGSGITQARLFSVIMSLIMITVLFLYLHQRMGRWALLPTLFVAVDGWIVFANRISWIDNSVVVLGILGVWAYFYALTRNTTKAYIFAGLALGYTLVFKQLGIYFCAIPTLNWLISRQRTREHLVLLGTAGVCALLYVGGMVIIYRDVFLRQTLSQVFRSSGAVTSRGVVANPQEVLTALVGQYHIFAFTVLLCGASLVWLGVDILRSIRRKDRSWLHRYSLEASWIIASIGVFIAIQIKFPNYFIYLMIPLLVYLGMRVRDVASEWLSVHMRYPRLLRTSLISLLVLAVGCDLGASYMRIVDQHDNALLQVANYVKSHIPAGDIVLADEPVGVMIPQPYCKLEAASNCRHVKWIITYTSITQKLPTQASDPQLYVLLQSAQTVIAFHGFKETITVYHVVSDDASPMSGPPTTLTGTRTDAPTTVTSMLIPAATARCLPMATRTPSSTCEVMPRPVLRHTGIRAPTSYGDMQPL